MSVLRKQNWLLVGCGLALGAAACSSGEKGATGPGNVTLSDPANTKAQLQAVAAPFTTPTFESFAGLSFYFIPTTTTPGVASVIQATLPHGPTADAQPYAPSVLQGRALAKALLANPIAASIFPPSVLGTTYTWNASSFSYQASSLTGAPSNGVRFIIYTLSGGLPASPLDAIGYVDITDESTLDATILGVKLVGTTGPSPVTFADYTISGSFSATSFNAALGGYVSDGTTRVDFSIIFGGTETTYSYETTIDIASAGVHIAFNVGANYGTTTETIDEDFTIAIGAEELEYTGHFTALLESPYTVTGTGDVNLNGQRLASWEYGSSGLSITYVRDLTPAEQDAITQVSLAAVDILVALGELSYPALFFLFLGGV